MTNLAPKLAIVTTHPIQYHSPWYRYLANNTELSVRVFYLADFGLNSHLDRGFRQSIKWDIPLLEGYDYTFVPNRSIRPGVDHFFGLWNPSIVQQIRSYAPNAVLVIGYNFASLMYLLLRSKGMPLIFRGDSHRIVRETGLRETLRRGLIGLVFGRFAAFLYVGRANYDYFRYHGVPEHKLFRAPHAVDNERFIRQANVAECEAARWKRELGIPQENTVILFSGKFEAKKRPLDLLDAFLAAKVSDVSLLYVGAGELEGQLRRRAAHHPRIHFAAFQNQTQMPRTYCAGDLLVLPSYGKGETWGLAVNEAMCMGRPVVVSDHVGCASDLVVPYENGLIFEAGSVAALTACIREAVSDRMRLKRWGERSRVLVQDYSYRQMTDGLLESMSSLGITTGAA